MTSEQKITNLARALAKQNVGQSGARKKASEMTSADMHPTWGSAAILQAAASGMSKGKIVSLNTVVNGSKAKAFSWDIPGFGWDQGAFGG